MKRVARLCFALLSLFAIADTHKAFAGQTVALGSGKSVEIIAVEPVQFSQGGSALMLKYRTSIPLTDVASLRNEVGEVWDRFMVDVEHAGYRQAIISANEPEEGGILSHSQGYNCIFQKKDGTWRIMEGKGREPVKLDEAFVKEFMDRMDWAYDHNEMNAFLLYLSDNFSGTFTEGNNPPQTVDRMKLAASIRQTLSAARNFLHQRTILKIQIADNGGSAQVESQEIEQGAVNGRDMKEVEHSIDTIEVQGNSVVVTKTNTSSDDRGKK